MVSLSALSPPRTSTSGRAPVLSMIIRFWISVDSLKRPPTLLTIPSSFNSSSIAFTPLKRLLDQLAQLVDASIEVVVKHLVLILSAPFELLAGIGQPQLNLLFALRPSFAKSSLQQVRG